MNSRGPSKRISDLLLPNSFLPNALSLSYKIAPTMIATHSSDASEAGANYLLVCELNSIEIPGTMTGSRRSSLKGSNLTTPDRQAAVSFNTVPTERH